MITINFGKFKEYKSFLSPDQKKDNFLALISFLRTEYKLYTIDDIYETLLEDELGTAMMDKREIKNIKDFEMFVFKSQKK